MSIQFFRKMRGVISLFMTVLLMAGLLAANAHAAGGNKITDYGDAYGHWAYEALAWAVDNGVMVGTSEDKISPDGYLTRAQMATMIDRLFGTYKSADISRYTDVSRDSWYYDYIAQAVNMGTFTGYSNHCMGPEDNITREQLASILYRYAQSKGYDTSVGENTNILSYTDALEISEYAIPAMQWACGAGIMEGNAGYLTPQGDATRAQVATMLMRFCENYATTK